MPFFQSASVFTHWGASRRTEIGLAPKLGRIRLEKHRWAAVPPHPWTATDEASQVGDLFAVKLRSSPAHPACISRAFS